MKIPKVMWHGRIPKATDDLIRKLAETHGTSQADIVSRAVCSFASLPDPHPEDDHHEEHIALNLAATPKPKVEIKPSPALSKALDDISRLAPRTREPLYGGLLKKPAK